MASSSTDGAEIPATMKALRITAYNTPYVLVPDVPVPKELGPYDLLVKVAVASHCHTDGMVRAGAFKTPLPCTGSHEGAGTVVARGSQSDAFRLHERVMCGLPFHPCGICEDCLGPEKQQQYCAKVDGHIGVHVDGCFAEYVRVDARTTTRLPKEVFFLDAAPLACAGRTVWRAVREAQLQAGQWLAIVGSGGGLGHLGVQFAKHMKLHVIAIDAREGALELTKAMNADCVLDVRQGRDAVIQRAKDATGGRGADAAINLSDADDAAALACAVTRMHGTMIQIAQPDEVRIPFQELVFRDIRVKSSLVCSSQESKEMVEFFKENKMETRTTPFYGLEKIDDLMALVESGEIVGKAAIVVDPSQVREDEVRNATWVRQGDGSWVMNKPARS